MKNECRSHFLPLLFALVFFIAPSAFAAPSELTIGDQAPPLVVSKWMNGDPVSSYAPGQIYLVDFWGTWCGPCVRGIPHLNELQAKYGSALTIIGMAAREQGSESEQLATLSSFMREHPEKMNYRVAVDLTGTMHATYLKAAGRGAIPDVYVVDGKGKILFIGHPAELDPVLDSILAGTYDPAPQREKLARELKMKKRQESRKKEFDSLVEAGNFSTAARKLEGFLTPEAPDDFSWTNWGRDISEFAATLAKHNHGQIATELLEKALSIHDNSLMRAVVFKTLYPGQEPLPVTLDPAIHERLVLQFEEDLEAQSRMLKPEYIAEAKNQLERARQNLKKSNVICEGGVCTIEEIETRTTSNSEIKKCSSLFATSRPL